MRYAAKAPAFREAFAADRQVAERAHTLGMRALTAGLKGELRDVTRAAGLGEKLANAWRGETYPKATNSLEPASYVWTKAAKIIGAFAQGATITPTDGRRYLAIPTEHVPLKGRGRRMTPVEVEAAFNQDLIVRKGKGGRLLAFVDVIPAKNKRGFRPVTKGRVRQGRTSKLVLMFILVRSVQLGKRIDPDAVAERWAGRFDELVQANWE